MSLKKPQSKPNFPEIESEISKFWDTNKIFKKSVEQRESQGGKEWRFYDGPPFISGTPHYGHIKDFIMKDAVPRYWTMKGYHAPRKWGWDCHGLPIENKVEKKLDIKSKLEVEEYGIKEYIDQCYEYTQNTSGEWPWYIQKMGRWIDYDNAYRTMDQNYMESVWWVFSQLWEKGLIYKGWRSSLYSTDSATPVSNFEIAMDNTYENVEDDSVTVKFSLQNTTDLFSKLESQSESNWKKIIKQNPDILNSEISLLSWTTTPWTLPANTAVAVNPEAEYVLIKTTSSKHELVKSWQIEEDSIPFDLNKQQQTKVTRYYLSLKGETPDNISQHTHKTGYDLSELTELEIYLEKVGKEYFLYINDMPTPVSSEEFVELSKSAISKPVKIKRSYYNFSDNTSKEENLELSEQILNAELITRIDIFQDELSELNIATIDFLNRTQEISFRENLPEWFGKEIEIHEKNEFGKNLIQVLEAQTSLDKLMGAISSDSSEKNQTEGLEEDAQPYHDYLILAKDLAEQVMLKPYVIIEIFSGKLLESLEYQPLYRYLNVGKNDHKVILSEGVTTKDGTGVLHVAPAFGEDDFELGQKYGLSVLMHIDDAGLLLPEIKKFAGLYIRDAAWPIINDLKIKDKLYHTEKYTHRLPFYRYENPLIYRAQESWYINVQKIKAKLFSENEEINWIPDHLKKGRFFKGLESAPDWSISRSRYWSTPMPVWVKVDPENDNTPLPNYSIDDTLIIKDRNHLRELSIDPISKINIISIAEDSSSEKINEEFFKKSEHNLLDENIEKIIQIGESEELDVETKNIAEIFGINKSKKDSKISAKIILELENKYEKLISENQSIHVKDNKEVLEIFTEINDKIKQTITELVANNLGENIIIVTNPLISQLLRHLFERKTIIEALGGVDKENSKLNTIYFWKETPLDLHRPVIDQVKIKHPETGEKMVRIPEVLDVWMDSGSMPFAQNHFPFANGTEENMNYPADFIFEYIAQTRAWFYVLHVLGIALTGKKSFKNVVTSGVIFGTDGRKMSKTYGNYPDPRLTIENYGAEAMRWYFLNSKLMTGEDINFDEKQLKDQIRQFMLPLWNSFTFLATYAEIHNWHPNLELLTNKYDTQQNDFYAVDKEKESEMDTYWHKVPLTKLDHNLDIWLIAKLQKLIHIVRADMDDYNIPRAARNLQDFLEDLSKWYIRNSRDRFNNGDSQAFSTLYYVLVEYIKLIAPFTPFISEKLYLELVVKSFSGNEVMESIHLCDYPEADIDFWEKKSLIFKQMDIVREITALAQSLRVQEGFKIRQPLAELEISLAEQPTRDWEVEQWMKDMIGAELNLKNVQEKHSITTSKGWVSLKSEEYNLEVGLNTNLNAELKREGLLREFSRKVQASRKQLRLDLEDKVELTVTTNDPDLLTVLAEYDDEIKNATGTVKLIVIKENPEKTDDKITKINEIPMILNISL